MRRIVLILIAAWVAMIGIAQTHYDGMISFGGKAGASFSRLNFNPNVQQVMLPGMTAGVMFRYIEEKNFGLIAELNMTQRGWKENLEESDYHYSHRFTYLELPIMTHIFFGNQHVKGFFNLGPEVNVMLGDGIKSNFAYREAAAMEYFINDTRHIEQMTMPINNRLDYGICGGAGMEVNLNNKHSLLLEGRFYYGLTDVFPNHKTDVFSSSNSMTVTVTLGYFYRLK
ncbi:MAG: PorT family protein [Muribaculaceae bacterium]|nr:PorT family protein [Muribaculaceae bacterium]